MVVDSRLPSLPGRTDSLHAPAPPGPGGPGGGAPPRGPPPPPPPPPGWGGRPVAVGNRLVQGPGTRDPAFAPPAPRQLRRAQQ